MIAEAPDGCFRISKRYNSNTRVKLSDQEIQIAFRIRLLVNMFMRTLLMCLLFFMPDLLLSQVTNQTAFIEVGGHGLGLTIQCERLFFNRHLALRGGVGIYSLMQLKSSIPLSASLLIHLGQKNMLEISSGFTYTRADPRLYVQVDRKNPAKVKSAFWVPVFSLNQRWMSGSHLTFRWGLSAVVTPYALVPLPALSVGFRF